MTILFSRLVVLLCCLSLFSCTTRTSVYPVAAPASHDTSWYSQIKAGDRLVITIKDVNKPVELKVKEITPSEIQGEAGEVIRIAEVLSVEKKKYSWAKNIGLGVLVAIILAAAAVGSSAGVDGDIGYMPP